LKILNHDPRQNYSLRCSRYTLNKVPAHKQLRNQPAHLGLPIGNLSSQFFANIYLNELDQHIKHVIKAKHYIRYVDDFIILHESAQWLNKALESVKAFLPSILNVQLNHSKTILQPVSRGVDFVGQVIKPFCRTIRKRTANHALHQVKTAPLTDLYQSANSYFGLIRQASKNHKLRTKLAKIIFLRGKAVNQQVTKTYRNNHDNPGTTSVARTTNQRIRKAAKPTKNGAMVSPDAQLTLALTL
jgi:RNA-directed DNA polymerase